MNTEELVEKGIFYDMSSNDYHNTSGTFSSSQLKTMLEDEELFYRKYVTKEIERESIPAFDVGTFFHTAVLEPHLLQDECVVFEGIRRGKAWDSFKEENQGKAIITKSEQVQADTMIQAVNRSTIAKEILTGGKAEASLFVKLTVSGGEIFSKGLRLSKDGWVFDDRKVKGTDIIIKVRADYLNTDRNYIADLKSTNGNTKSEHTIKSKISNYSYDLSASLYLDIFSLATSEVYDTFYWIFASKDVGNCKTYKASPDNVKVGRQKWKKAVVMLARCIENNWEFEDTLGILEPQYFEREWLIDKAEDNL